MSEQDYTTGSRPESDVYFIRDNKEYIRFDEIRIEPTPSGEPWINYYWKGGFAAGKLLEDTPPTYPTGLNITIKGFNAEMTISRIP